jgi:4-azaleucine resistance transporter AzlC
MAELTLNAGDRPWIGEARAGALTILPAVVAAVPFGLLLGALAARKGLSALEVALMSGTVFAGAAQFVAVDLWRNPVPVAALLLATAMVNVRHLLMGAALRPHVRGFPPGTAYAGLFLMADEVWALALSRAVDRPLTLAFWFGLGGALYPAWIASTTAGAVFGAALDDPARFGLDFAFVAIFIGLLRGLWRGRSSALPWVGAAAAAVIVHALVPGAWYVAAGGLTGLALGALRPAETRP